MAVTQIPGAVVVGVQGPHWVTGHDPDLWILLLQVLAGSAHGATSTGSCDQVGELAPGLLPDLWSHGGVMSLGIHGVVKLVGKDGARGFLHDLLGLHHVVVRMVGWHGRRGDYHLSAVGLEQPDLLLRHLVGHGEDTAIALEGCRNG